MPSVSFSVLGSLGGTGCDEVRFPLHGGCDSRDVSVAGMCDCVKECLSSQPVLSGPLRINNGAHDIEKLLLNTQVRGDFA